MLPEIWFLRHGETEWNLEGRIQGRRDSPLTARGHAHAASQARIMAPILTRERPAIRVSPLGRAVETARVVCGAMPFTTDPNLAEIHCGDWEGRLRTEVARGLDGFEAYCAAPNGEGFDGLAARVNSLLGSLDGPTVLIAHGILGKVLRGTVLGLERPRLAALENGQGCVYHLKDGVESRLDAS
ncbi:histidine phosphatase family protein [Roseovarius sp. SCSIO 43702]|uniref:histidine phosphatase family protein n=1 Tax=Roseovarius sp. SCSIO 43702 TaxID=2823043 RepID=UPI0028780073|nr:histidine phosphatase family protein [Roseovarius sp. SCSIO 43702]